MLTSVVHNGGVLINSKIGVADLDETLALFSTEQHACFVAKRFEKIGRDPLKCPRIIVLIGPPGSGKSTWIKEYLAKAVRPAVVLSSDDQIDAMAAELGITYSQMMPKIDMKALEQNMHADLRRAVAEGADIIVDRTNLKVKSRRKWMSQVPSHYVRVAVNFNVSRQELNRRIADRAAKTGKNIPADVVSDMIKTFEGPSLMEFDIIEHAGNQ